MSFLRRARGAISLALAVVFVTITAGPAHASRDSERPRAGASTWVPREVSFQSTQLSSTRAWLQFEFKWAGSTQRSQLEGDYHTFEINAEIPCSWLLDDYDATNQGYDMAYWATNVPTNALPFEDTIFGDSCQDNEDYVRYGVGVLKSEELTSGTTYYIHVGVRALPGSEWENGPVKLVVQTGTWLDTDSLVTSYDNADCSWSSGEKSNWNATTGQNGIDALNDRLEASWCAWPDWTHLIAHEDSGVIMTGDYEEFDVNKLSNYSLDSSGSPAANWSYGGSGSATRYCNDPAPAFQGSCFVQFNGVSSSMSQSVPDSGLQALADGHVTAEAAVRCRSGSSCEMSMLVSGEDTTPSPDVSEDVVVDDWEIPNDGHWYICRVDYDHSDSDENNDHNGNDDAVLEESGGTIDAWDFILFNWSGGNLDVDFAFLGAKTHYFDADYSGLGFTVDPDGEIAAGDRPPCTEML